MTEITPETLARVEADWSPYFMESTEIAPAFGRALRQAWDERDKIKQELKNINQATSIPLDDLERKALKSEIEYNRNKFIELEKETNEVYTKLEDMTKKYDDMKGNMGLPNDELLETYLHALEDKFKVKFDESFEMRVDDKISGYVMTAITLAYHLVYSARVAWKSAIMQCDGIIDQAKRESFAVQTRMEEAPPIEPAKEVLPEEPKKEENVQVTT